MPVSVDDDHPECDGFAVVEPDGSIVNGGCMPEQSEAEDMRDAINASKSDDAAEIRLAGPDGTLHIFRAGTHKGANGNTIDYSEQEVASIASLYDPDIHEAPLVIGHPSDNEPAFGWVQDLSASGPDLRAEPHQVEQNFAEAVRSGRFKKISASFYPPSHPNHPVPSADAPYLRHVGFLGAKAPAVKGLDTPQLADDEDVITITHDLTDPADMADDPEGLLRRMMSTLQQYFGETEEASELVDLVEIDANAAKSAIEEMISGDDGMTRADAVAAVADEAEVEPGTINAILRGEQGASMKTIEAMNKVIPGFDMSTEGTETRDNSESTAIDMPDDADTDEPETQDQLVTDDASDSEEETDQPTVEDRLDELEEKLDAKEDELEAERKKRKAAERKAERVDDLSEAEQQVRRREIEDAVQEAAENGRIHAKHAPLWCDLLELADEAEESLDNAVIDFSDAGVGPNDAQSLRETLEYIMNNQGPVVALGELDEFEEDVEPVDLSDVDSIQHAAKQEQKRAKDEDGEAISFSEAVSRIQRRTEAA